MLEDFDAIILDRCLPEVEHLQQPEALLGSVEAEPQAILSKAYHDRRSRGVFVRVRQLDRGKLGTAQLQAT